MAHVRRSSDRRTSSEHYARRDASGTGTGAVDIVVGLVSFVRTDPADRFLGRQVRQVGPQGLDGLWIFFLEIGRRRRHRCELCG
jgi:hypothetical protein